MIRRTKGETMKTKLELGCTYPVYPVEEPLGEPDEEEEEEEDDEQKEDWLKSLVVYI